MIFLAPHFSEKRLEILKIRLRYLKNIAKNLQICSFLFNVSVLVIIFLKWTVIIPFFNRLFFLAQIGDIEKLQSEIMNISPLIRYSPIIISIAMFVLATSMGILSLVIHRTSKIEYTMALDVSRLLMFFATVTCCLSAILWVNLGKAFLASNIDEIANLVGPLYFSERMFRLCFFASFFSFMISLYRLRSILVNIVKVNKYLLFVFIVLGFLTIIDISFAMPFFIYCLVKRRIIYGFAYLGIYKNK